MEKKKLEQALLDYAINEIDSDTVASILNVDANDIQGTLADFSQEWDEADEPEDSDAVIDKYVDIFTYTGEPQDIELTKHNSGGDYLTWTYNGKEYWCQGEFYVDSDNNLHHTFYAPSGKAVEIVTPYES